MRLNCFLLIFIHSKPELLTQILSSYQKLFDDLVILLLILNMLESVYIRLQQHKGYTLHGLVTCKISLSLSVDHMGVAPFCIVVLDGFICALLTL